jgi:hypothetical protein
VVATWLLPSKYARFRAKAVERGYPADKIDARFETAFDAAWGGIKARLKREPDLYPTYEGPGRLDALQRIANQLFAEDLKIGENNLTGEGPVSFPYLWDIWLFDWVQYNGSVRQPMVRNVGEALGVNARTNLVDATAGRTRTRSAGGAPSASATSTPSRPPTRPWVRRAGPPDVLPPVDRAKAAEGRRLFVERCAGCHAVKLITDRPVTRPRDGAKVFEWHVPVIPLAAIGTDPVAATSFARNRYDASKLGIAEPIGAADGLKLVAGKVKDQAYDDAKVPVAERKKLDGFGRENLVTAPCGYRARPLVGVWATPPFLHNGSVPSLVDLLSEERPPASPGARASSTPSRSATRPPRQRRPRVRHDPHRQQQRRPLVHRRRDPPRAASARRSSPAERAAIVEYLKARRRRTTRCSGPRSRSSRRSRAGTTRAGRG